MGGLRTVCAGGLQGSSCGIGGNLSEASHSIPEGWQDNGRPQRQCAALSGGSLLQIR